jgi:hypothetical protein
MRAGQNQSQPNAQNQYPNAGPGGRFLSQMPAPFTGENGMFTQAYNNVGNTMENHPIFKALSASPVFQMLLGGRNRQQPPTTPPTV